MSLVEIVELDTKRLALKPLKPQVCHWSSRCVSYLELAPEPTIELSDTEAESSTGGALCPWHESLVNHTSAPWMPQTVNVLKPEHLQGMLAHWMAYGPQRLRQIGQHEPLWHRGHNEWRPGRWSSSKQMLLSWTSCCCTKQLWDCEWVRRLRSWPNLNRHMSWNTIGRRRNGFWVFFLAFVLGWVFARCL